MSLVKITWKKSVRKWYTKHPREILNTNKVSFAPFLKEMIGSCAKWEALSNGFKACELYPLNSNAFDCSECLQAFVSATKPTERSKNTEKEVDITINNFTFIKVTGGDRKRDSERIEKFRQIEYVCLVKMWISYRFFLRASILRKVWNQMNSKILLQLHCNIRTNLWYPAEKDLEVPRVTHDREEKMTADHDGNLGSRIPKEVVSRNYLQAERYSSSLSVSRTIYKQ
jgi:hypothetical protein